MSKTHWYTRWSSQQPSHIVASVTSILDVSRALLQPLHLKYIESFNKDNTKHNFPKTKTVHILGGLLSPLQEKVKLPIEFYQQNFIRR